MILLAILGVAIGLGILAITYYLYCIPQEKIADKMGEHTTWMAYVPVARNIQRMRMTGLPTWWFLFVGSSFTVLLASGILSLVGLLLMALNQIFGLVVFIILEIAYLVFYFIATYKFNLIVGTKFGFHPAMALVWMFMAPIGQVITYVIALSDRFYVGGKRGGEPMTPPAVINGGDSMGKIGLEGISGMYSGAEFPMSANEPLVIGRDGTLSNVIVSANSDKVSRRHCTVRYIAATNSYEITDHSTNGTFYGNTRLVKDQPTSVVRGTTIVIGDKVNQFKLL